MDGKLPRVTAQQMLGALGRDGWLVSRQSGSHAILRHPVKRGRVVVPRHPGRVLKVGTVAAILTQAQISADEFRRLL